MAVVLRERISTEAATVEQVLFASRGDGAFVQLMKAAVGLSLGTIAIEVTLLGYLVPCVASDWDLSSTEEGSLTASIFGGEILGAILLGVISDSYGRRPAFLAATILMALFGALTAFAGGFWALLFYRTMVGVGAGGMAVPFDLMGEMVTKMEKNRMLVDIQLPWAIGAIFVGVAAWAVLTIGFSWRLLSLVAVAPTIGVICCFSFILESPRWLMANGREAEAKQVLRKIAKTNGVHLADRTIVPEKKPSITEGGLGGLSHLWRDPVLRSLSVVGCVIWASYGFLYYGVILLSSKVMGDSDGCSFDYPILFFACVSEVVSNVLAALYVNRIDRRVSLTINFALSAVMAALLPTRGGFAWLLITSFCARGFAHGATCFSWVITPGLYPTEVRSTGHAVISASAQLGAVGASYWVATSVPVERIALLLCAIGLVGGFAALALPSDGQEITVRDGGTGFGQAASSRERMPLLHSPVEVEGVLGEYETLPTRPALLF